MAVPTVASATSYVSPNTAALTWTPLSGYAVSEGDYLVFVVSCRNTAVTAQSNIASVSTGWTLVSQSAINTDLVGALLTYKIPAGVTSVDLTVTGGGAGCRFSGQLYHCTGANSASATHLSGGTTTNSNPPAHDIGSVQDGLWIAVRHGLGANVASAAPASYTNLLTRTHGSTSGASTSSARRALTATQTEDPGTFTSSSSRWSASTVAVWDSGTSAQTITPGLFTNGQTFFPATVAASYAITAPLVDSATAFFGPTVTQSGLTISPALLTNGQAFFGPTVSAINAITAPLLANAQTFFPANVVRRIAPSLIASATSFFAPTVQATNTISPALLVNSQTFYGPTLTAGSQLVTAPRIEGATQFFAPSLSQRTTAPLLANAQTFFAPSINRTIAAPLLASTTQFFAPTINRRIEVPLLVNANEFFPPALAFAQGVAAPLVQSATEFFPPTLRGTGWNRGVVGVTGHWARVGPASGTWTSN